MMELVVVFMIIFVLGWIVGVATWAMIGYLIARNQPAITLDDISHAVAESLKKQES